MMMLMTWHGGKHPPSPRSQSNRAPIKIKFLSTHHPARRQDSPAHPDTHVKNIPCTWLKKAGTSTTYTIQQHVTRSSTRIYTPPGPALPRPALRSVCSLWPSLATEPPTDNPKKRPGQLVDCFSTYCGKETNSTYVCRYLERIRRKVQNLLSPSPSLSTLDK